MSNGITELIQACEWASSHYLVFSENVFDPLIYYSHLAILVPVVLIGFYVYANGKRELPNILLLITTLIFATWVLGDSILWATEYPQLTMYFWTLEIILEPLVYFFIFYFFYSFVFKKDLSLVLKALLIVPVLPTFLFASTRLGLLGYNLTSCDRDAYEGALTVYGYGIEILYVVLLMGMAIYAYRRAAKGAARMEIMLFTTGIVAFLLSFSLGNIVGIFTDSWSYGQFGLFGAPIFAGFLAYIIVRFKAFNIGLLAAQALIVALVVVLGAEYAFVESAVSVALVSLTLVFTGLLGIMLIRSVRREVEQRQRIEKLAEELEQANDQQVVLIHFITHQIKGFVTKSRNIFSMALEGDFGALPDQLKPMIQEGFDSDTKGVATIQEILNASNIKSGKVEYVMASFDLKALIEEIVRDLKAAADKKGIALVSELGSAPLTLTGDRAQLTNAFKNLIDNSIKYTPTGEVRLRLAKEPGKILFTLKDTGIGITAEDMAKLFTEGGHGKESTKVNVESTGFGLYIVKNIIDAHKGRVWAESEGAGKGSRFIVSLPA